MRWDKKVNEENTILKEKKNIESINHLQGLLMNNQKKCGFWLGCLSICKFQRKKNASILLRWCHRNEILAQSTNIKKSEEAFIWHFFVTIQKAEKPFSDKTKDGIIHSKKVNEKKRTKTWKIQLSKTTITTKQSIETTKKTYVLWFERRIICHL